MSTIAPTPTDATDPQPLSPFDRELRRLPSLAIGTLIDIHRESLAVLNRRAKRDGWAAGREACANFIIGLVKELERESERRDREQDGRR